jgi:uncharacterized protein (DUF488 family)
LLAAHDIDAVADVRRFPASRRHPHFSREQLEPLLAARGIAYRWIPELGGRRPARKDSVNTGWRVAGFRGYADYMESADFSTALAGLLDWARERHATVMCAESLWWQCHRRLIADALLAAGHEVRHIESTMKVSPHRLIAPARMQHGRLTYAAEQPDLDL